MKCNNCGFQHQQEFDFCPNCGTKATPADSMQDLPAVESVSLNPAADVIMPVLRGGLFLTVCILMTVASGLSVIGGNFSVINILLTIFLWLTYSEARRGFASEKQLRNISGTVYANYIIVNVACGLLAFLGVLFGILLNVLSGTYDINELFAELFYELDLNVADINLSQAILSAAGWIFALIFIVIAAVSLVINILGMRKIHRLAKSTYQSVMFGTLNLENPRGAKNWLIFFGVCSALSTVSSLLEGSETIALATGCVTAAEIISAVMINKYLLSTQNNM